MARKFGIEVEFGGSMSNLLVKLYEAGLAEGTRQAGYLANSPTHWVVKADGSVSGGGELVSPPLDWDDPEQRGQVERAFACLIAAGCRTDTHAGVHVHIDANDLSPQQVAAVARTFTKFEDQIYRIASSGWQTIRQGAHEYAKPMQRTMVEKIAKAKTKEQLAVAWYGFATNGSHGDASRYHGLNLNSWFYRGTVEFRVFNSTLNAKRALAYITLSMAIVQDARDGVQRRITKPFALGTAASLEGEARKAEEAKQLHHLSQMLRWENKTTPIPKEDLDLINYVWKNSVPQKVMLTPTWSR